MNGHQPAEGAVWAFAVVVGEEDCAARLILRQLACVHGDSVGFHHLHEATLCESPFELFTMFEVVEHAAETAGIDVPWTVSLQDGELHWHPTDRALLRTLEAAVHQRRRFDFDVDNHDWVLSQPHFTNRSPA